MKRIASLLLAGIMCVSLAACGGNDGKETTAPTKAADTTAVTEAGEDTQAADETAAADDAEATTLKDGVLQVAMEIGYPPMEYYEEDGSTPTGFDVEVGKAIAAKLGLEAEFVDTAWDGIFAGLDTDKYDCVISAVSINEDRQANYNLTEAYISNKLMLVTPQDSEIASLDDLSGKTVAVQGETTADYYIQDLIAGGLDCELMQYDKVINCFDELKTGRTDAVFTDSVVAAYYLGDDAAAYKTAWENSEGEPMAICLKKGNDELTAAVEKAIDELYEDGTMATIAQEYFGSDITEGLR